MIALAVLSVYLGCYVATARLMYRQWRGHFAGRRHCEAHGSVNRRLLTRGAKCCYDKTAMTDGEACFWAMLVSLAFPAVWLAALVRWHPKPTERELEEQREAREQRIAELTAENDRLAGLERSRAAADHYEQFPGEND